MYDYSILPWGQNSAKFSEIKGIIRSGKSMGRQYNGKMKQTKRSKSDLHNTAQSQFNDSRYTMHITYLIPGLQIIATFDWLKPRLLKTHSTECC